MNLGAKLKALRLTFQCGPDESSPFYIIMFELGEIPKDVLGEAIKVLRLLAILDLNCLEN